MRGAAAGHRLFETAWVVVVLFETAWLTVVAERRWTPRVWGVWRLGGGGGVDLDGDIDVDVDGCGGTLKEA
ncbi:hypothetical protein Pen01_69690 [Phytomonospora endophytica]|nr:hypothetical protein Pen01_69690 [Phytomonospora endophytica]